MNKWRGWYLMTGYFFRAIFSTKVKIFHSFCLSLIAVNISDKDVLEISKYLIAINGFYFGIILIMAAYSAAVVMWVEDLQVYRRSEISDSEMQVGYTYHIFD